MPATAATPCPPQLHREPPHASAPSVHRPAVLGWSVFPRVATAALITLPLWCLVAWALGDVVR